MAPTQTSHDFEDPDFSLASLKAPSLDASEDMIPLVPSTAEPLSSNDSDSSSSSSSPQLPHHKTPTSRSRAKKARRAAHQTQASKPFLRPAKDILSRIRHDPSLNESDFIVGYIDRHAPEMMEMDVSAWKGGVVDFTDEEWIPQHRIMYFRKKGDEEGRRVWDRVTRLDRLFGSGVLLVEPSEKVSEEVSEENKDVDDERDVGVDESEDRGDVHVMSEKLR